MNITESRKQKHLTQDDRVAIQAGLTEGKSIRSIALGIGKDPTTVSKEIRKHRVFPKRTSFNSGNTCAHLKDCNRKNVCNSSSKVCTDKLCRRCPRCNRLCPDYEERSYVCPKTVRAPFVCNACKSKGPCRMQKAFYRAQDAQNEYRSTLVDTRRGLNISEEELLRIDAIVSPLIRQGQSPYMILRNHPEIQMCEKTLYNYIDQGALSAKNMDLPKKIVYKIRKSGSTDEDSEEKADKAIYEGRTYDDYLKFLEEQPDVRVVEMDTVIGCSGSHKVLLTLHFNPCEFMMAYLLENKKSESVKAVFDDIEDAIGDILFSHVFQLTLTDRGGEFKRPNDLECDDDGVVRTSIYYCDPMCPWQKPHCEKNHEYIRKIRQDGSTFDDLTQKDIILMMSHINSAARESLGGRTPFELAHLMLPKELLDCFKLREILPDEVNLTPELLK